MCRLAYGPADATATHCLLFRCGRRDRSIISAAHRAHSSKHAAATCSGRQMGQPDQSCPWVHFMRPDPTLTTQPTTSGKIWTQSDPTHTTNNGAYSLVVTHFYTHNLSRTFSRPSINVFMFFADSALNASTYSFQMFSTFAVVDPTEPNPWVKPTHGQL